MRDTPGAYAPQVDWNDYDAALFDLDGVITPTAEVHMRAWSKMFNDFLVARGGDEPYTDADYHRYVDGKPRYDGVRSFLESRGITLSEGTHDDPSDADTVSGLGNRKNDVFLEVLHDEGVEAYPGSLRLVEALTAAGVRRAIVSSSRNAPAVLEAAGDFGLVVGVNRGAGADALREHGADIVVDDLEELL